MNAVRVPIAMSLFVAVAAMADESSLLAARNSQYKEELRRIDEATTNAMAQLPAQYRAALQGLTKVYLRDGRLEAYEAATNALAQFERTGSVTTNELSSPGPVEIRTLQRRFVDAPSIEEHRWFKSRETATIRHVEELEKLKVDLTKRSLLDARLIPHAQAVRDEISRLRPAVPVADVTPTVAVREPPDARAMTEDVTPPSPNRRTDSSESPRVPSLPANLKRGLCVFCPLDGGAQDFSGSEHHGTLRGGVAPAVNRYGASAAAIRLDGVDDCVLLDKDIRPQYVTISLWFRTRERMDSVAIIRQRYFGFGMVIDQSGTLLMSLYNSSVEGRYYKASTKVDVRDGEWHNAVLTYGPSGFCGYIDNKRMESPDKSLGTRPIYYADGVTRTDGRVISSGPPEFSLGRVRGTTEFQYPYFKGEIDDLCVWDRELNAAEVDQVFRLRWVTEKCDKK